MDIKELQDYRLSDAIKFHTHLNPRIWGRDEHLLPEVREKLMAIAADFKEFLGLDLEVKDITISGSNAAYTYTDHSDIDLHLVTDLPKADASEIYRELFDAKKYQYNDQHNFKIGGYDVELYVQNANQDPKSQGIYSVLDNKWISVPKRRKPDIDDISVRSKYEDLGQRIEAAVRSGNREQLETLGKKVREFRQAGLDRTGEFGPENLAFKILRSNGTLDQLRAARLAARDQELSIEEAKKKKKKKAFKYGFGGYYFPGYHYYGQTDAAADGGGGGDGGGGESVRESAVFLNPNAVIVGQDHNKPLNLTPDTLKKVQSIAAKHGARYEGNGKDRTYTKGQIDKYVGSWDDEVAKTASPNDPKWLYVLFANVDENNRVQQIGVDAQDTIFNRLLATARDNSFQGIGFTSQALQKFLSMASEGKYDFVKMSQQPATQENLTRFLKAGEALMWPGNWEQYPNKAGKIAKSATVDVRDQYLATRKAGVYVTGSGHLKAVQDITGQQGVAEGSKGGQESTDDLQTQLEKFAAFCVKKLGIQNPPGIQLKRDPEWSRRNATFGRYVPETNVMILSVANRHPMDIMRTLAHELVHRNQDEHEPMPDHAGATGSEWENEANAKAGVLMRSYGEQNPDTFDKKALGEASGYIPVTDAEARDPRYSMAVTVDIKPGEPKRQAAKLGWKTNAAGTPPTARTNGLVEALTKKLQAVKEGIGFPLIGEQDLEEVAMSPGSLKAFAASDIGQSMMAGFEAELVFSGVNTGSDDSGEMEPDYDYDPRADDIDRIMDFFTDGDMAGIDSSPDSRSYRLARSQLEEDFFDWFNEHVAEEFSSQEEDLIEEWILNNDWDQDRQIEEFLREELELSADEIRDIMSAMERRVAGKGTAADADLVEKYNEARIGVKEQLELRVTDAIQQNNSDWESAQDEFRENYTDADESDWLRSRGYRYMSDVGNHFDFEWPRWTTTGGDDDAGYNSEAAQQLADSLTDTLDVETTVASGYHSARRDDKTWIFEPDSSLDADESGDMPVEIVSPPMPLGKTLEILPKFFEWAKSQGAYANDSTGFHMSVSMPDHGENVLDYTKLALFLGDEYVLKQFGREANTYAKSAISKIRDTMGKLNEATETRAEAVLSAMRNHLNQFASRAIAQPSGFGKYTSINPKTNYIEFRSAGGSDYFADMDKIQNTLMRYARATDIAMDPAAEKAEYARKLYKLLTRTETEQVTDPKTGTKRTVAKASADNDAISIFSRYVAGDLPKSELKGFLKQLQYGREVAKNPPKEKIQWQVTHPNGRASVTLMAASAAEAIKLAKQEYNDTMNPDDAYRAEPVVPAAQTPATDQLNAPVPDDPRGNFVLRRREGNEGVGPVLYRFSAGTTGDAIDAARRWTEARGIERRSVYLDSIESLSPEELQPAASTSIPDVGIDVAQNFQDPPASWDGGSPIQTEPQNFPAARSPATGGEFTGRWKIVSGVTGEVLHTFVFRSNDQAAANGVARDWAQRTGFDDTVEVYPEMG